MEKMQSFLIMFYMLEQCYEECKEDDLGGLLGMISPELWTDNEPIDRDVINDWVKVSDSQTVDKKNIVKRVNDFLCFYEQKYGFNFEESKRWLCMQIGDEAVEYAIEKLRVR